MMKRALSFSFAVLLFQSGVFAQLKTESKQTAEYYVKHVLMGPGVAVGKVRHIGMVGGLGQFEADAKILGLKSGLVMSTGNVDSLKGPNNQTGCTTDGKLPDSRRMVKEMMKGDQDLNKLCRSKTRDITVIEFEFVPVHNVIEFNYVFASEEYPEYVGSVFNDVFGFFISGPGLKKKTNLAVLPDGKTPVTINTINEKRNKNYFRRNKTKMGLTKKLFTKKQKLMSLKELNKYVQMDGFTTVLSVHCDVIPYRKYRMKIAIGDVTDEIYDSAVFIEAGSFTSVSDTAGKYYDKEKLFANKKINVDSILSYKPVAVDTLHKEELGDIFEITDIYFDVASDELNDTAKSMLNELAGYLKKHPALNCTMMGYTDNTGSKKLNQELSDKRALRVIAYLQSEGIESRRMKYSGHGFSNPRASNLTESGRARNRRVEIMIEAD